MTPGGRLQHCTACHRDFRSEAVADAHRTGSFNDGTRRCRTDAELLDMGLRRAVSNGERGAVAMWFRPMPEAQRERLGRL